MSLPPAVKDTSEHPPKNAVAAPVNKANKDADIDRKMRLYGVVEAFRQGRMPDNAQIDRALKYAYDHTSVEESKLSRDGRKLVQDARDVIETARLVVQKKNGDELFQKFMWDTRDVDVSHAKKDPKEVVPVTGDKLQQDKQEATKHLRTLLNLLATNSEARKLLSDFSVLGRDVLARAATHAADMIRPDEEKLKNIDQSAPADEFRTEGDRPAGTSETPVAEASIPGINGAVRHHPERGLEIERDGQRQDPQEARDEVQQAAQSQAGQVANQVSGEADRTAEQVNRGEDVDTEAKKKGFVNRLTGFRDGILDRVPQEQKDTARDKFHSGKKVLLEEYFPESRRDQFIYRGKKVIVECQRHDDYQESINWLISFAEEYASHGKTVAGHGKESHGKLTGDSKLNESWTQLRTLLERFANGQSMDPIFHAVNHLIDDARSDEEFRNWWKGVDSYARKVLLEPGFVLEPQCNNEGRDIRESGRKFYDDKYREHFDRLFNSVGDWFKAMGEDPLNKRLADDFARLTRDLLFDPDGNLQFKPDLWLDIRKVILPTLVEQVGYIPIPRIEYSDESLDLVVENLTLQGRNIFPNIISMESHNFVKFSPYSTIKDQHHHEFTLTLGQIQADMRDVALYFRRKQGIPKITDSGLADVLLGGQGLTATIHLVSADQDKSSVFKVKNVHVKVDGLKFSIRDSKHDILYKTIRPVASALVKRQLQKAVSDALTTAFEYIDGQLVGVRDRYTEAKSADDAGRTDALKAAFRRQKEASGTESVKSSEKEGGSVKRGGTFKMVAKRNSAIVQGGHDAGYSIKAQEKADEAVKGETWHSQAFSIV